MPPSQPPQRKKRYAPLPCAALFAHVPSLLLTGGETL